MVEKVPQSLWFFGTFRFLKLFRFWCKISKKSLDKTFKFESLKTPLSIKYNLLLMIRIWFSTIWEWQPFNSVVTVMENHYTKSCISAFRIFTENYFQKYSCGFSAWKFALKSENVLVLTALSQLDLQDIEKSSQYVHLTVKFYWYPLVIWWYFTTVTKLPLF